MSRQGSARTYGYAPKGGGAYVYTTVPGDGAEPAAEGDTSVAADVGGTALLPEDNPRSESCLRRECRGVLGIFCQWMNLMLIFVPLGIWAHYAEMSSALVFSFNFAAIVPLAGILGASTECLAAHTGQMLGGLLNATFGNAVELIVTVNAIRAHLVDVVQGSLMGSVLSNLLLVMGMAFFAAGCRQKESHFSIIGASASVTCLQLAAISIALPTIYTFIPETDPDQVLWISRLVSIVIACVYLLFLFFQLFTHADMFGGGEDEEEEASLSLFTSTLILFLVTLLVAYCSDFLVDSIEGVSEQYGVPKAFIGVILLPIVGNAAEHATAVTVAAKGKMDLALGVAVGSSTQIALFVVPFSVIVGWVCDVPMTLNFRTFDAAVMLLSVFMAGGTIYDGTSNWLEGAMLVALYTIIAVICWFVPDHAGAHTL